MNGYQVLHLVGPATTHFKTGYPVGPRQPSPTHPGGVNCGSSRIRSMVIFFDDATYRMGLFYVETLSVVIAVAASDSVGSFLVSEHTACGSRPPQNTLTIGPFAL